jgi:hypothetical protein
MSSPQSFGVGNGKLIYNVMTKDCDMAETSFGTTYQKLVGFYSF